MVSDWDTVQGYQTKVSDWSISLGYFQGSRQGYWHGISDLGITLGYQPGVLPEGIGL